MILECTKRDESLKAKQLRRTGFIPGVIYGKNLDENVSVQMNLRTLNKQKSGITVGAQLDLVVDGEEYNVLIKSFERSVMKKEFLHFDFQVLTSGEKIKTSVPIHFINKDQIKEEGNVQEYLNAIEYEVLPKDMLETIEVDLSVLEIGKDISVSDLAESKDERYHILTAANSTIVSLSPIHDVVLESEDTAQVVVEEEEE